MEIDSIRGGGHANASTATLTAHIDDWQQAQVKHHIRQQGIQIARDEIDVAHDVTRVKATPSGWEVEAVVLEDVDDDDLAGHLFTSDNWSWNDDKVVVSCYMDNETDQQEQIRGRVGDEIIPIVANRTPFSTDMMALKSVNVIENFRDKAVIEI